jgi:hypothetical protein
MKANNESQSVSRRRLLKGLAGIPLLSLAGAFSIPKIGSKGNLSDEFFQQLDQLKGKMPEGKLGKLTVSRVILGCNPIIAWSHARDLIYPNRLMKAYMTDDKIIETLHLCRLAGINSFVLTTEAFPVFNKYRKAYPNDKMLAIAMGTMPERDVLSNIKICVDNGADAVYVHGRVCDAYARSNNLAGLAKGIDYIKQQGLPAGVGAHCLETIEKCEKDNFSSDFYMKTFHHDKYWSALPENFREPYIEIGPNYTDHNKYCDNMWDLHPQRTVEVMKEAKKPFIAFKIMAAGAIQPRVAFRYAFENGADFICVGMFDFQVVDNVNLACEILGDLKNRERKWYS